jgi:phenylalanyl-tRNA synthetase beta chain
MVEVCGAQLMSGGIDCHTPFVESPAIHLRVSRTTSRLGITLTRDEIAGLLGRIAIQCQPVDEDTLSVTPPSFRVDLEREIDLIEEVARLQGYDAIPLTMPAVPMALSVQDPARLLRSRLSAIMVALGVFEAVNYSFTSDRYADLLGLAVDDPLRNHVKILNPLADDQGVMRTMLLPGLLENLKHNVNRQNCDCGLFEIGKVFWPLSGQEQPREAMRLGAVFTGRLGVGAPFYHYGTRPYDIFDLKGMVESTLGQLGILSADFAHTAELPPFADHDSTLMVRVGERVVGYLGRLDSPTQKRFGIKQTVYFLDIDLDAVMALKPTTPVFKTLSKYPSVSRDLAVVVPDTVGAGSIVNAIMAQGLPLVSRVEIFDVYRGKPIADGLKSVALSITYHSEEQTLEDTTVTQVQGQLIDMIRSRFDGHLREV